MKESKKALFLFFSFFFFHSLLNAESLISNERELVSSEKLLVNQDKSLMGSDLYFKCIHFIGFASKIFDFTRGKSFLIQGRFFQGDGHCELNNATLIANGDLAKRIYKA